MANLIAIHYLIKNIGILIFAIANSQFAANTSVHLEKSDFKEKFLAENLLSNHCFYE